MSRECRCMGENENCYICGGSGIIKDVDIGDQTATDWSIFPKDLPANKKKVQISLEAKINKADKLPAKPQKLIPVKEPRRRVPVKPPTYCPICSCLLGAGKLPKHLARHHPNHSLQAESNPSDKKPAPKPIPGRKTDSAKKKSQVPKGKSKPVVIRRAPDEYSTERPLDGSRDYYRLRDHGKFGSHPSFDSSDDDT